MFQKALKKRKFSYFAVILPLAAFVLLAFGPVMTKLGIYWDDWAYIWTRLELGFHGLLRHFSFSRPVAGQLHNIAILLTDGDPLRVQGYGLVMQLFGAFCFGLFLRGLWRGNDFAAAVSALLFIAYPGFTMRPIAINFSFSYFLMGALSLSFLLGLSAERTKKGRPLKMVLALFIAVLNLFASEYFFLLELLRPIVFWMETLPRERAFKKRLLLTAKMELPYVIVFALGMAYRLFFNKTQTLHYEFSLLEKLKTDPLSAIVGWLGNMFRDCFRVVFNGWAEAFRLPDPVEFGSRSTVMFWLICLLVALVSGLVLCFIRSERGGSPRFGVASLLIGILALLLAGQPFWLTESSINFVFPNCRYTLPFMPGIALVLMGLLSLFWNRPLGRRVGILITALLVGMGAGRQFVAANEYRRDWTLTKDFFWQLKWRVPALEENTVIVTNVLPIRFSTDNSLTAPLNWIYADSSESYAEDRIPYMLYTNTKRGNTLSGITSGHDVFQEYLSGQFYGNTDDMLSVYYNAPGCVHVLDPQVDVFNQTIPELDREAALLNDYSRIHFDVPFEPLSGKQFGPEPAHGWCWYYETADLARQKGDWEQVAALGDGAFALSDHANDPMELIPFIEGYARVGRWADALSLTDTAMGITPVMNDALCAVWNRIDRETELSERPAEVSKTIDKTLDCGFIP